MPPKKPLSAKKSVVKTSRPAKTVTKKATPQRVVTTEAVDPKILPTKKPQKHVKIQTAEGWKRSLLRQRGKLKSAK